MTKLVIVESPGKIKKIKSFLGNGYIVMASVGHIRDLAKESISVDPNNNFQPTYEILVDKKKVVAGLRKTAKECDEIYIASDGDREGEAIGYHLVEVLNIKDYHRIVFNEITKSAITKALSVPKKLDMNMFYSQQTRRILDRIVGYKLSPILKSIPDIKSNNLGAGRVQSVVTRLIVDKEKDINEFLSDDKSSIYNIIGDFIINGSKFKGSYNHYAIKDNKLIFDDKEIDSVKIEKSSVTSKDDIKFIVIRIRDDVKFTVDSINTNDRQRHPQPPFITSSLQQEASYKLRFQLKKTMMLAQKLYEKGLITYMRTDSPMLSNDALFSIKKQVMEDSALGEEYYQYRQFKSKNQNAQEAHEAIRPTHFEYANLSNYDDLSGSDEEKLYQLIWNRTVASQLKSAKYQDQHIKLINSNKIEFEGTNSILIFDGYLKLYRENSDDDEEETKHIKLNNINLKSNTVSWLNIYFKETYSSGPTRYNEPSLVKKLEGLGIGRPSTYAAIISKIQEHNYIRIANIEGIEKKVTTYILSLKSNQQTTFDKKISIQKIGNEKSKLVPTFDGIKITDYLVSNFPQIMDYKFTAKMEDSLDEIAQGNKIWYEVLRDFYHILKEQFTKLNLNIESTINYQNNQNNQNNQEIRESKNQIIGKYPKYGDIYYMETKYGPAFKVSMPNKKKDIFVGAGNSKPSDQNVLDIAIKLLNNKINYKSNWFNSIITFIQMLRYLFVQPFLIFLNRQIQYIVNKYMEIKVILVLGLI